MELQTKVPLQPADDPIDYQGKVLLFGSCFVENMGDKLEYFQFPQYQNPFGVLFQPLALENLVKRALESSFYQQDEVFCQEGIWRCFDAHSEVRSDDQKTLVELFNQRLRLTRQWVESASHIIITLGTAWVYEHIASQKIVANCHKVPQREFTKNLLSVDTIQSSLENLVSLIGSANPKAKLIFTISPVRHLKDGFVENQQSKSHLITALHHIINGHQVSYFPAYEIMMDELRDYRFYAEDMVHPNALAVDYIWEKFKTVWISSEAYPIMDEVESVRKGLQHRPFNPGSEAHRKFKASLQAKITYLQERYPFMKFE